MWESVGLSVAQQFMSNGYRDPDVLCGPRFSNACSILHTVEQWSPTPPRKCRHSVECSELYGLWIDVSLLSGSLEQHSSSRQLFIQPRCTARALFATTAARIRSTNASRP